MNISRFNDPQWYAKSTLEKNLSASANSINPKLTFTALSHPPDFGNEFRMNFIVGQMDVQEAPLKMSEDY